MEISNIGGQVGTKPGIFQQWTVHTKARDLIIKDPWRKEKALSVNNEDPDARVNR